MTKTEKHLSLEINSEKLNYYIKYNDVKIHTTIGNAPTKESIPVNQWSLNGINTLLISVNLKDENHQKKLETAIESSLSISLVLTEIKDNKKHKHNITTFNLMPKNDSSDLIGSSSTSNYKLSSKEGYIKSENGDILIKNWESKNINEWIDFTQNLDFNINMPAWAYLDADNLGDDQSMTDDEYYSLQDELYEELEKIWSLMNKKDLNTVLELTKIRSNDFEGAYYLSPGSKQKEMEDSLTSAFNHKDLYLDDLVDKNFSDLKIEANGKIAKLQARKVGTPLMYYSHKDEAFTRYYDFYFMKKDGKLIIVR